MNCPVIIALLLGMVGGLGPMPAAAGECPYPLTPLAPVLAKHADVVGVTESSSGRDRGAQELEGRAAIRTSIHFNDDSTAYVEQQGYTKNCDGITYTIRIDFPSFDEAAYKKSVKRLYWLLEPTLVVANWRKHNLDYQPQFSKWMAQVSNTEGNDLYFDSEVSWPNKRGDLISLYMAQLGRPAVLGYREAMVLWIGIGPEVDVGEGD
ncbi:MAG: hypothetical protein II007_00635 [Gammaproteobacteria bacterium]|nr:hypothetical protein [Gammaproteobacteria bacterium]